MSYQKIDALRLAIINARGAKSLAKAASALSEYAGQLEIKVLNAGREARAEVERQTRIDLWYSNLPDTPDSITVCLMTVRAANDLIISYDYGQRDGWVISMQPSKDGDGMMEDVGEPIEVAFVDAWIGPDGKAI